MTINRSMISILMTVVLCCLALLSAGLVPTAHAANTDPELPLASDNDQPFPVCDERVFLARPHRDPVEGDLVALDLSSDPILLVPVGPRVLGLNYNAMAYNPADDFLYAIKQNSVDRTDLLRIGADGQPKFLTTLDGIGNAIVGEFGPDGYYYIADQQRYIYKYDLSGPVPVLVGSDRLSRIIQDFGFYDGYLWTVATQDIGGGQTRYWVMKIDFSGPTVVETFGPERIYQGSVAFTSVFAARNGIYAYNTTGGEFVKLNMPSDDINEMDFVFLASGETLSGSDGAKCPQSALGLPVEIAVTKTSASTEFAPGSDIDFTITVENQGPWGATGILLEDPLPAGVTGASWTCVPDTAAASCAPASGTGAISSLLDLTDVGTSVTFTVTMQTDPAASSDIVNTAKVTIPDDFKDGNESNNEATFTKAVPGMDFSVEKSGALRIVGPTAAGDFIDYEVTVRNDSEVVMTAVTVDDPGPVFGGAAGTGTMSPFTPQAATLNPDEEITFSAIYTITEDDLENLAASGSVEVVNEATISVGGPAGITKTQTATSVIEVDAPVSRIGVEKFAEFDAATTGGVVDVGARILYTVRLTNEGTAYLRDVQPVDEGPTFGGHPATNSLSSFEPASANLAPGESADFLATYVISEADMRNAVGIDSIHNAATATGLTEAGTPVRRVEVDEAALTPPELDIAKRAEFRTVMRGGSVPFVITVNPVHAEQTMAFSLVDTMPAGFTYVNNSARINGRAVEPEIAARRLVFPVEMEPDQELELRLDLAVSAAVQPGVFENRAHTELIGTAVPFGKPAVARVEVALESVFDCGDVLGRVFSDEDRNGYMDQHERGVPQARVVAVDGITVTTDDSGRFHITCADLPQHRIGSTLLLKLDPGSLPSGYRILGENPRAIRLTAGKASMVSFATSVMRVIRVDINEDAFHFAGVQLRHEWHPHLLQLISLLQDEPSVLRLSYIDRSADRRLAARRVDFLRETIQRLWQDRSGHYRLEIESRILSQLGQGWDDVPSLSWIVQP